jgi:UDP-N-acetylglucosamine 2-epimerase
MKILTVVGARPQFIKAAPVSKELRKTHTEVLVHTGQHYDDNMSQVFFNELNIPQPGYNLGVGSGSHAVQTGHMMMELEEVMLREKPDFVLVYGDTNSTLAGALTASKLDIPIGHIEAGLRNFDMSIPEEINRVVADRLSTLLFCPTVTAVNNLTSEGIKNYIDNGSVYLTGDVMCDAVLQNIEKAEYMYTLPDDYIFCTLHRPSNVDGDRLEAIMNQLRDCGKEIVFPVHPRTHKNLKMSNKAWMNVTFLPPVPYLESIYLIKHAKKVITDSGGVQKEAYILKTPCITVFPTTAWEETVADGWNVLVEPEDIIEAVKYFIPHREQHLHYGDGHASQNIVKLLNDYEHTHFKSPHR